jgi:ParB-like chromosome segregation protein Spo0J
MGLKQLPAALADDLTDVQIKAFRLLANKSANWASWDEELLSVELGDLRDVGFDLGLTGFSEAEIEALVPADPIGKVASFSYREQYGVTVICKSEAEQRALYERLVAEGLTVKVVTV